MKRVLGITFYSNKDVEDTIIALLRHHIEIEKQQARRSFDYGYTNAAKVHLVRQNTLVQSKMWLLGGPKAEEKYLPILTRRSLRNKVTEWVQREKKYYTQLYGWSSSEYRHAKSAVWDSLDVDSFLML